MEVSSQKSQKHLQKGGEGRRKAPAQFNWRSGWLSTTRMRSFHVHLQKWRANGRTWRSTRARQAFFQAPLLRQDGLRCPWRPRRPCLWRLRRCRIASCPLSVPPQVVPPWHWRQKSPRPRSHCKRSAKRLRWKAPRPKCWLRSRSQELKERAQRRRNGQRWRTLGRAALQLIPAKPRRWRSWARQVPAGVDQAPRQPAQRPGDPAAATGRPV
mmetsp:Transcript_78446/g.188072  ORF Transcript_78446/g.188072 Transcript_78446/m.188072 type:complete len:212 (+) Transcript_78446:246-881(+)